MKKNNSCNHCNKSFTKVSRGYAGKCRECDTSSAGTWMLSYLSELDYIIGEDDIMNGYVYGTTNNNFLGLANGTLIHCCVDEYDRTLFHAKCDIFDPKKKDDEEEDIFGKNPTFTKIDFKINLGIEIVNPIANSKL